MRHSEIIVYCTLVAFAVALFIGVFLKQPSPASEAGWFVTWMRFMVRYLCWSLLIGVPLLWLLGVFGYAGWIQHVGLFNRQVKDLPSLCLFTVAAPFAAIIIALPLWAMVILPCQLLWWMVRRFKKAIT